MTWLDELVTYAAEHITERERDALLGRGVSSGQIELYGLGHLDGELPEGLPDDFAQWAADKIDDVYLLPLTTTLGDVRGLQLRHVDRKKPGYQDYFDKPGGRSEACLFGLGQAISHMWESGSVTLVEGAFDLFPIQRATPAVVSTLTAHVAAQLVRVLRRTVKRVHLCYDNDAGGEKGVRDFRKTHGREFEVYVVGYPTAINGAKVKDPGDLWEVWGDSQLIPYIQGALLQQEI
jgi:Toprim-like